jgi:hypothetical protein
MDLGSSRPCLPDLNSQGRQARLPLIGSAIAPPCGELIGDCIDGSLPSPRYSRMLTRKQATDRPVLVVR